MISEIILKNYKLIKNILDLRETLYNMARKQWIHYLKDVRSENN